MEIGETLQVVTRDQWRAWLEQHHQDKQDIWLIFHKKLSGKPSIAYRAAVEEAVCFGWIDSQQKGIDAESYAIRFTPRRKRSSWSQSNKTRALDMLHAGKMSPIGMATLPEDVLRMWNEEQ